MKDSVIRLFFLWEKQNVATDGHEQVGGYLINLEAWMTKENQQMDDG